MIQAPQPGDFFLAPIPSDVGKAIQFGQWLNGEGFRRYQHAGILLHDGETMEAMPGGAIIGQINRWKPEELKWSSGLVELTDEQRAMIVRLGYARHEVPYSFVDYMAISLHRFHVPAPHLKKYIADSGHQICSQMVDWVYLKAGKHLFNDGRWEGYVTPASLLGLLEDIEFHMIG